MIPPEQVWRGTWQRARRHIEHQEGTCRVWAHWADNRGRTQLAANLREAERLMAEARAVLKRVGRQKPLSLEPEEPPAP